MKVKQLIWESESWKGYGKNEQVDAQLVRFFGSSRTAAKPAVYKQLKAMFPESQIVGYSTAGEIISDEVRDNTAVVTAISFEKTTIQVSCENIENTAQSFDVGQKLARSLPADGLKFIFVHSDRQISSHVKTSVRELHNQTMTTTLIAEK